MAGQKQECFHAYALAPLKTCHLRIKTEGERNFENSNNRTEVRFEATTSRLSFNNHHTDG